MWGGNTNLSYAYSQYLDDILGIMRPDILSYDYYPFIENSRGAQGSFNDLMVVRQKAQAANVPYWGCVQASYPADGCAFPDTGLLHVDRWLHGLGILRVPRGF